jgi:hypothetical protein
MFCFVSPSPHIGRIHSLAFGSYFSVVCSFRFINLAKEDWMLSACKVLSQMLSGLEDE